MARTNDVWETGIDGTYIQTIGSPNGYDLLINGTNHYINFNSLVGSSGYGIRDNGGTMEFKNSGGSWTGFGSGGGGSVGPGTINEIAYFNTTTTITSLPTATYPSLTELSYVKGVTSAIQTQLNAKGTFTLPALTAGSVLFSNGTTIIQDNANFFYDSINHYLGLGTATPGAPIEISKVGSQMRFRNGSNYMSMQYDTGENIHFGVGAEYPNLPNQFVLNYKRLGTYQASGIKLTDNANGQTTVITQTSSGSLYWVDSIGTPGTLVIGAIGNPNDGSRLVASGFGGWNSEKQLSIGSAGGTNGILNLNGSTSGTVSINVAVGAGTWTLTLPITGGTNKYFLQTNGSGVSTWAFPLLSGSFSQVGAATTTFTVTIGTTMANNTYQINVTPTVVLSAALFYVNNKTTTTFDVVYLAGLTGTVTFDWAIYP